MDERIGCKVNVIGAIYGYSSKTSIAFGVHLKCGDYEHQKVIKLKTGTTNVAELTALEYALKCLDNSNHYDITLDTCNAYAAKVLQKDNGGNYTMTPEKNVELIKNIRTITGSNVVIAVNKSELLANLQQLVKRV